MSDLLLFFALALMLSIGFLLGAMYGFASDVRAGRRKGFVDVRELR